MKKITVHLLKVYSALKDSSDVWLSINQIAEKSGINPGTTKHHVRFLYTQKILERAETYPHVYKIIDPLTSEFREQLDQLAVELS